MVMLLISACAHKAPPIAKDRLGPRLQKIAVLNVRQVQLSFSEEIDTAATDADSIFINSDQETVAVLFLYPSLSASEIVLVTMPMKNIAYDIRGSVCDTAENRNHFKSRFLGTTVPDTIAPWLTGHSQGRNTSEFYFVFSEAMDTTLVSFSIIPKKHFAPVWLNSRYLQFSPQAAGETLSFDTTYYLFLKSAHDFSGNRAGPFVASITRDTLYKPIIVLGKVLFDGTPINEGVALLKRGNIIGIALVVKGELAFEVRDSTSYEVQVIAGDYSGTATIVAGRDNIIELEKDRIDIDRLID
jgi:hypothetical protein